MTQLRARRGNGKPGSGRSGRIPYLELLRTPGALAFSSAGLVGRMSMSMYGLGTVLLIALLTGRYGQAGTVAAAGSVGYAVFGPFIAQRADRLGQRRVLLGQAAVFALSSTVFIGCAELGAPFWTLLTTGILAPASGIGAASLLCIAGTVLFAVQRGTAPAPRPRPAPGASGRTGGPRLPAAGLVTLAPAFLLIGAMFSAIDLSTVAFATELGHRPVAGLILGTFALGSAVGGLWYGSRHWRAPIGRRFTITAALTVLGVSAFWAVPGLLALDAVGFVAGLAISPTLMTGYAILERP